MKSILLLLIAISFLFGSGESGAQEEKVADDDALYTKVYRVAPAFLTSAGSSNSDDPFAETKNERQTVKTILEEAGIQFPPGATAVSGGRTSQVVVRNTAAQLKLVDAFFEKRNLEHTPKPIHVFLEFIEVEDSLYHEWMFENRLTGDAGPLRRKAQEWVKAGEATIIETSAVTTRSGQRAKVESVGQKYYPTEPGTPAISNKILLEGKDAKAPVAGATASSFDRRNVGTTLEIDPVLGQDKRTLDFNLSPEIVSENGVTDWPPDNVDPLYTVSMARFYAMKITTQITASRGKYEFLGTTRPLKPAVESRKRPIVMIFIRADVGFVSPIPDQP